MALAKNDTAATVGLTRGESWCDMDMDLNALLLQTTDASVWAGEFCKIFPVADEGTMLCWFANAIETGRAAGQPSGDDGMTREDWMRRAIEWERKYRGLEAEKRALKEGAKPSPLEKWPLGKQSEGQG